MSLPHPFEDLLARVPSALTVAVVGASNDERKYGSIIVRAVQGRGSRVVPVTPTSAEVHGVPAVASIAAAAPGVDLANFVVPPARTLAALRELGAGASLPVWLQPGSYDDDVLAVCKELGLMFLVGPCILVEFDRRRTA